MFTEELMDSSSTHKPAVIVSKPRYFPLIEKAGSIDIATKAMMIGTKQAIKIEEIVTTIFDTFVLRLGIAFPCFPEVQNSRHLALLRSCTTSTTVHTMITTKAQKGMQALLMM